MKLQKAKKVAIKYDSYRVIYLFMDVPVLSSLRDSMDSSYRYAPCSMRHAISCELRNNPITE